MLFSELDTGLTRTDSVLIFAEEMRLRSLKEGPGDAVDIRQRNKMVQPGRCNVAFSLPTMPRSASSWLNVAWSLSSEARSCTTRP